MPQFGITADEYQTQVEKWAKSSRAAAAVSETDQTASNSAPLLPDGV